MNKLKRLLTFHVFVRVSASLRLLNGTKDLFPCRTRVSYPPEALAVLRPTLNLRLRMEGMDQALASDEQEGV